MKEIILIEQRAAGLVGATGEWRPSSEVRFHLKSVPIQSGGKVPIDELVHTSHYRKRISKKIVEQIAIEKYIKYGKGIDYTDVIREGSSSKEKSQCILKDCCSERRDKRGELHKPILFRAPTRTSQQQFFPNCVHADIIEDLKKWGNVPIHPTGVSPPYSYSFSSKYTPSNSIEHQKAQTFLEVLIQLPFAPPYIHKLQLMLRIDKECYNTLIQGDERPRNRAMVHEEIIGRRHVVYTFSPNGSVEVGVRSSDTPFRLETDEDESVIFSFFGQVRDRLLYHLNDIRERLTPPIMDWILKQCDLNKDVEIDDTCQLTLPDIQLKHADRVFRLYVKSLHDKSAYRSEESLTLKRMLPEALESIRYPIQISWEEVRWTTRKN
jgi:hypothetical protein